MAKRAWTILFVIIGSLFTIQNAQAFYCKLTTGGMVNIDSRRLGTLTANIPAITVQKTTTDIRLTNMAGYAICNGDPVNSNDQLTSMTLEISDELTALGFIGYFTVNGYGTKYAPNAYGVCLWGCPPTSGTYERPLNVQIGLRRTAGSGSWGTISRIPAGTRVAKLQTAGRGVSSGNWPYHAVDWHFVLSSDMVIPTNTCSVTQYDNSVRLPEVSRTGLMTNGPGRYSGTNKEFKINLSCDEGTTVSVTFEGDNMTGQDAVLENKDSGNPNVGVQLLFNNSTVVTLNEKLKVADSTASQESFSFNAYYFYNGGNVAGGTVRAVATFLFDYD